MPYIVVNHDKLILSRTSPNALLSWEPTLDHAIEFETAQGALRCADMQGGEVHYTLSPDLVVGTGGPRGVDGDSDFGLAC